jgi:hypothetical protein
MLFSRLKQALNADLATYFEPDQEDVIESILSLQGVSDTLTKVLIGRVTKETRCLIEFDKHVLIYRDPRDQFVSMLLYLFYDFQLSGDQANYDICFAALRRKQLDPQGESAIGLYNQVASSVGRASVAVFDNLHMIQKEYIDTFGSHLARYEDLLDGNWGPLEAYLNLNLSQDAEVPTEYSRVVRSKGYGDWRNWLNEEDMEYVDSHWRASIEFMGYELEDVRPDAVISPETSVEYVSQFNPRSLYSSK